MILTLKQKYFDR